MPRCESCNSQKRLAAMFEHTPFCRICMAVRIRESTRNRPTERYTQKGIPKANRVKYGSNYARGAEELHRACDNVLINPERLKSIQSEDEKLLQKQLQRS